MSCLNQILPPEPSSDNKADNTSEKSANRLDPKGSQTIADR